MKLLKGAFWTFRIWSSDREEWKRDGGRKVACLLEVEVLAVCIYLMSAVLSCVFVNGEL